MREFKHLKSFESFSQDLLTNEEVSISGAIEKIKKLKELFTGPISKAISQFESENSDLMKKLKEAEKEGGEKLKKAQKELSEKLPEYKKKLKSNMGKEGSIDNDNDINLVIQNLKDVIYNIKSEDTRSFMQKVGAGTSGGFPGGKSKK